MNKIEFLNRLEKNLKCLNKEEVTDILSEYSQHIDNKISEGKDEIHSISDFGDVNTLSKEILSAYSNIPYFKLKCLKNTLKYNLDGFFSSLSNRLKKFGKSFTNSFKSLLEKNNFEEEYNFKLKSCIEDELNQIYIESKENKTKNNSFKNTVSSIFVVALQVILTIFIFIPLIIITTICIISFSTTLILTFQGYPLIGICFISAGFSFCCLTLFICLAKFVYPRRKKSNEKVYS